MGLAVVGNGAAEIGIGINDLWCACKSENTGAVSGDVHAIALGTLCSDGVGPGTVYVGADTCLDEAVLDTTCAGGAMCIDTT